MNQWPLDDTLAQLDKDKKHDQIERTDDGKGAWQTVDGGRQRVGCRKRKVDDSDNQQYAKYCDEHHHRQ